MEVDCEGCAGCCLDWRALAPEIDDPERAGPRKPIDDAYNLVPLTGEEVRAFVDAGYGDALTPRLWRVVDDTATNSVSVDGYPLAAFEGRPVFYIGLRKPPKPVAPFDRDPTWLPTCAFLDPTTLQCRIHDDDLYPASCAAYPGHNLMLEQETECERVERAGGGTRLLDDEPPTELPGPQLGPQALGAKLFVYPDPESLDGRIERLAAGRPTDDDRATFVAVAAASSPGTASIDDDRKREYRGRILDAESWVGRAIDDWRERAETIGDPGPDPETIRAVEDERGAPGTPGWR